MNPLALGAVLVAAAAVGLPLLACIIAYMCRRRARVNYDPLYASAEDDLAQDSSDSDDLESAPAVADGTSTDDLLDFSQPPSGGTVRTEGLTSATWVNEMNAELAEFDALTTSNGASPGTYTPTLQRELAAALSTPTRPG